MQPALALSVLQSARWYHAKAFSQSGVKSSHAQQPGTMVLSKTGSHLLTPEAI